MNKERFIKMLEQAKEDEYGRLYVIGEYNNKIYFGTITTICEDIFRDNGSAEIYDRHFWNDDTLECYVISTKHNEDIEYKELKRIEEIKMSAKEMFEDLGYTYQESYFEEKLNENERLIRNEKHLVKTIMGLECQNQKYKNLVDKIFSRITLLKLQAITMETNKVLDDLLDILKLYKIIKKSK